VQELSGNANAALAYYKRCAEYGDKAANALAPLKEVTGIDSAPPPGASFVMASCLARAGELQETVFGDTDAAKGSYAAALAIEPTHAFARDRIESLSSISP
jgi:hypothetical protein